jgi:hypothetical protein
VLLQQVQLVLYDLAVDLLVELAVIQEDRVHLLELLHDEVALVDHGLDANTSTHKILVDRHEFAQLLVIDHVFETFYFILQADH